MSPDRPATQDVAADQPDRMLTAKEVADLLNIHVSTVYRLGPRLDAQRFGEGKVRPRGFRVAASKVTALKTSAEAA